ncbi:hypothetical protein ACFE04_021300 [Oxalis oulophora]
MDSHLSSLISISTSHLVLVAFSLTLTDLILAGKHMVGGMDVVRVLDCSAFHNTRLVCSGDLAYLGGSWSKTVGSAVWKNYMVKLSISIFKAIECNTASYVVQSPSGKTSTSISWVRITLLVFVGINELG